MTSAPRRSRGALVAASVLLISACGEGDAPPNEAEIPAPATVAIEAPQGDDCIRDPRPGAQTLECGGLSFELSVPEVCMEKACGLIIDVHGFGMNGTIEGLHSELPEIAGAAGFIVVNPSAPLRGAFNSWSSSDDDRVLSILESTRDVFQVMDERIHMTGYSQGGFMTWRFLCDQPQLFGSVAPLAAGSQQCLPGEQPDILYGHGTTDGLVPFEGAITTTQRIIETWDFEETEILSEDDAHIWRRYENPTGTIFEFLEFDWETDFVFGADALLAHCFPGNDLFLGCGADNAVHWGEEVTRFFLTHPRS